MATVHITTYAQLQAMQSSLADDYILDNDIDCSGEADFVPIAEGEGEVVAPFTGSFDGQGFTISNLRINWTTRNTDFATSRGLFGYCSGATIQNINLDSPKMFSYEESGFICGYALNCAFNDCHVTNAEYNGDSFDSCGGLIGYYKLTSASDKNILDCSAEVNITCDELSLSITQLGGLIGFIQRSSGTNFINIDHCTSDFTLRNSAITDFSSDQLGGFIGGANTGIKITDCGCDIDIYLSGTSNASFAISSTGGFFGKMRTKSEVTKCHVTGTIVVLNDGDDDLGSFSEIGGFVGDTNGGQIAVVNTPDMIYRECFSTVDMNIEMNSGEWLGGFAGGADGNFNKCYYNGTITFKTNACTNVAGFIASTTGDFIIITECYSKGDLNISTLRDVNNNGLGLDKIGGFVADLDGFLGSKVFNCYSRMNISISDETGLDVSFLGVGGFYAVGNIYCVNNCYATGDIDIISPSNGIFAFELVGGFCGANDSILKNCFSVGIVTLNREFNAGTFNFDTVGGFVGDNAGTITNCAWFTDAYSLPFGNESGTLESHGWGTDEDDNTLFYTTDHPVYNQS